MGDQFDCQCNSQRYQNEIIQISKNWHKIRNQVNGAKGISNDTGNKEPGIPGRPWVTRSKVKRKGFGLDIASTLFEFFEHYHGLAN